MWEKIDSAPKDQVILTCEIRNESSASGYHHIRKYTDKICAAHYIPETQNPSGFESSYGWYSMYDAKKIRPSHWMPLPDQPD